MHETAGCYNGKLYYLVNPSGEAQDCTSCDGCTTTCYHSLFSPPPGIDSLDGLRFGGVTVSDLITGSVRTYIQNGNENGGATTDPTNGGLAQRPPWTRTSTTPGFIRIPVCNPNIAFTA